jgi:anthranilate phosphoribosyltransferase
VLVVHGHGGLDELSLSGPSTVFELAAGDIKEYTVSPEDVGLSAAPIEHVRGGNPEENAVTLREVLGGKPGPIRDITVLNAAAALVAGDKAKDIAEGVRLAAAAIDSGAARDKLNTFVSLTASLA